MTTGAKPTQTQPRTLGVFYPGVVDRNYTKSAFGTSFIQQPREMRLPLNPIGVLQAASKARYSSPKSRNNEMYGNGTAEWKRSRDSACRLPQGRDWQFYEATPQDHSRDV